MSTSNITSLNHFDVSKSYLMSVMIVFTTLIIGCNQEDEVDPVTPEKDDTNEILLAGSEKKTWLIVSSKKNGVEWLPECMKDDDWEFTRSYNFSRNSTSMSCSNGIPDSQISSWSFGNYGTWLTFGGGTYEIITLTEAKMVLTFPKPNGDVLVDTWVKK
ncbi:hypothetical protein [Marinoscillum furvescens]|uniref:Lipocalin-like protein n=1 Tax=Marinoscillum furvescens DSM 4134 TaxID=1122208 RepID=A0A3D9KY94_MARFU|nr:hypothetical protein [Marinoscillum furvescens]RED92028.1 hypothetical protein C7460_13421 [Marinoscillum furvescens DSM 4134]